MSSNKQTTDLSGHLRRTSAAGRIDTATSPTQPASVTSAVAPTPVSLAAQLAETKLYTPPNAPPPEAQTPRQTTLADLEVPKLYRQISTTKSDASMLVHQPMSNADEKVKVKMIEETDATLGNSAKSLVSKHVAEKDLKNDDSRKGSLTDKVTVDPDSTMQTNASIFTIWSKFSTLEHLLEQNKKWAAAITRQRPDYFNGLSMQQSPQLFWIGCSDSRVPANQIISLEPGEVFVHRNVANVVTHADLNCLSVLQFAVDVLKVRHVIVCGHYGCGGVLASMTHKQYGLIDNWLRVMKDLYQVHQTQLESLEDGPARADLMCELNVANSVKNVAATTIVQNAWERGQQLSIHGWCYRLSDGIIRDLGIMIQSRDQVEKIYRMMGKDKPEQ